MQKRLNATASATAFALAALGLAATPAGTAADAQDSYALKGEVYPTAFKIEMKTRAGRKLVSVKAGTYRIKIEDPSAIHNFHLIGPGVNKATSVPGKTERIWTVTFKKGTYRFLCDPHATMRGSFRVT